MSNSDYHLTLIHRYLQGELSPGELEQLIKWKNEDPAHQQEFDQVRKIWEASQVESAYEPDVEAGWQRFRRSIENEGAINDTGYLQTSHEKEGQVARFNPGMIFRIAASLVLLLGLIWVFQLWVDSSGLVTISTAHNETRELLLPDSSVVWLNENSSLAYESDFMAAEREVTLKGEAFFDVKKTRGKRFTIFTEKRKIEVVGTSFNVKAYADQEFAVQVVTGRVAVTPLEEENYVYLEPEQAVKLGVEDAGSNLEVIEIEDLNFQSWRTRELTFRSLELGDVLSQLESFFNVEIAVPNQDLLDCKFTGQFTDPDLDEVLRVLEVSLDLSVQEEQNRIILSGQGCK